MLAEFEKLAQEYVQADAGRKRLGLDLNSFAIYTALRPLKADLTVAEATLVNAAFLRYPDAQWSEQQAQLRTDLYKLLRPLVGAKFLNAANTLLKLQRI